MRLAGRLLPTAIGALVACSSPPADVNGTWSGQATDPGGGTIPLVLQLSAKGSTVTGKASTPPDDSGHAVQRGVLAGNHLSFEIIQADPDGNSATFAVSATVSGSRMRGAIVDQREHVTLPFALTRNAGNAMALRPVPDDAPPRITGSDPVPVDAVGAVLGALRDHEIVGLGILSYANQDFDSFILELVRDPAFRQQVDDIVVECGNSLYQPVLDRYTAGADVPLADARRVWRNTTQPMCGLSSFYEQLFPLVRRINATFGERRQLRVLAGDPPVDWTRVRDRTDLRPFGDRDRSIAGVVEREVLAKHRRALMVFGVRHLMHGGGGAVGMLERAHPEGDGRHLAYVIMAHNGFGNGSPLTRFNDQLEQRLASWPVPSLAPLAGTWLANLDYGYFFPGEGGSRIAARVDAYLYLGPRALLLNQPISLEAALDTAYLRELARRATVRDRPATPAGILQGALDSTVFFNPHAEVIPAARKP